MTDLEIRATKLLKSVSSLKEPTGWQRSGVVRPRTPEADSVYFNLLFYQFCDLSEILKFPVPSFLHQKSEAPGNSCENEMGHKWEGSHLVHEDQG